MPGPSYLANGLRGSSGNAVVRLVRGATFGGLVGTTGVTAAKNAGSATGLFGKRRWAMRYKGNLYAAAFNGVYVFDPIALTWGISTTFTGPMQFSPAEMAVCETPSGSYLIATWA
ncbi:unnamed protein product, partial [marine sediment metagenome]